MVTGGGEAVRVAEMFEAVARALASPQDLPSTLEEIARLAVVHLDACDYAGFSLVEGRTFTSPATDDAVPRTLDRIQSEVGEGPCLDAIAHHDVFQTGDLAGEGRWPRFAHRAHEETGVSSVLSIRLFIDRDTMGALNLYALASDAFDEADVALASVFAAHAAVAMAGARRESNLVRKAANRELIGEAKGILMARSDIDEDAAFDLLRRASQRLNIKVTEVADQIVHPPPEAPLPDF